MTPDIRNDDDLLVVLRGALVDLDTVPDAAVDIAVSAFDLGGLDAELAELQTDSFLDGASGGLRHDGDDARIVVFRAASVSIELDLAADGGSLIGQVEPAEVPQVDLEVGTTRQALVLDGFGRFRADLVPGPLRLHLATSTGPVVTPWVVR